MTFLPIVERELRVAARRPGTYWLRLIVALGLMLVATWIFLVSQRDSPRSMGQVIFYTLTGGLMLYCLLAGMRSTADCLSEEKRDGTLGLLFLTDLRGYDVVMGKLTANSLATFYCVVAVLPVLAIPLLLGGVAGAEFGRFALVLVNTLFFSLSAGMLASALCQSSRAATFMALLLILLVAGGVPALGMLWWWLKNWSGNYEFPFVVPSPVFSYFAAVDTFFTGPLKGLFYWSLGVVQGIAWLFLALASWLVPRSWQDRTVSAASQARREAVRTRIEGDPAGRREFRTRLLDQNAFYWLATRPRSRALWGWVPLLFATVVWIWGLWKIGNDWFHPGIYVTTAFLLGVTMKGWIGAEVGRQLLEDRKSGALELLLSTPLSVREVLRGQLLALNRQFLAPVSVMLGAFTLMLLAGLASREINSPGEVAYWTWLWLAWLVMFAADGAALYWLGMWTALTVKNPKQAFGAAVAPVLALPWIGVGLVMTIVMLSPNSVQRHFRWDGWPLLLWFSFGIAADLFFGLMARQKLLSQFREVAAQRFQPRPSFWQRWFGRK